MSNQFDNLCPWYYVYRSKPRRYNEWNEGLVTGYASEWIFTTITNCEINKKELGIYMRSTCDLSYILVCREENNIIILSKHLNRLPMLHHMIFVKIRQKFGPKIQKENSIVTRRPVCLCCAYKYLKGPGGVKDIDGEKTNFDSNPYEFGTFLDAIEKPPKCINNKIVVPKTLKYHEPTELIKLLRDRGVKSLNYYDEFDKPDRQEITNILASYSENEVMWALKLLSME